jgi:peroxiredoxin
MPKVELNQKAPEFALADFTGRERKLSEWAGARNVVLVFNRGFS